MTNILQNQQYVQEISKIAKLNYNWEKLHDQTILITGATGLIGSFLIDVLMLLNKSKTLNCKVIAVCRNKEKAMTRFSDYLSNGKIEIISQDINKPFNITSDIDYIIHAASNTHPKLYSSDPIGTITTNVIGTYNLLELAIKKKIKRFVFLSSVEIYGENVNDLDKFTENDLGYINCNTLRAGYPESKRTGEALLNAYIDNKSLDGVIVRLSRIYGPTVNKDDSRAISQFINKAINNENIILKSEGNQYFSYNYVGDAVSAILFILLNGKCNEAYNVSDESSNITLKDLALIMAEYAGTKVVFDMPSKEEAKGYSTATRAILDATKLQKLGWSSITSIKEGLNITMEILKTMNG